jgi:hypothetical protein
LGITKEDLKDVTNATDLLPILADRLGQVRDTAAQVQIARKLGIEGLLPLLREGSGGIAEMRDRAQELGLVLSNETVKGLADADREMEIATRTIQTNLRGAFAGLATDIAGVTTFLANFFNMLRSAGGPIAAFVRNMDLGRAALRVIPGGTFIDQANQAQKSREGGRQLVRDIKTALSKPLATNDPGFVLDLPEAGGGGKSKGAKARDNTLQGTQEIERSFREVERDLLNAWQGLLVEAENRAELQRQLLELEIAGRNAELDRQKTDILADEGLSAAKKQELAGQIEKLREQAKGVDDLRREGIDRDLAAQKAAEALSLKQNEIQAQEEALQLAADLARTAGEERRLRLALLDLADQRVRIEQEAVLASKTATEAQKEEARRRIAQVEATRGGREAQVRQQTQGPLESYFDTLPQTAAELNERLEALAANGIASVTDGLAEAIVGARSFGDVFKAVIAQMAVDLTRLNLQRALTSVLSSFAGGTSGVSPSVNGVFGYASGGLVRGPGSGTSDDVMARLSNGEFVVNAAAAKRNLGLLRAINSGLTPRAMGPSVRHGDTFNLGGITITGADMVRDPRRAGSQIAAETMRHLAIAKRRGF